MEAHEKLHEIAHEMNLSQEIVFIHYVWLFNSFNGL